MIKLYQTVEDRDNPDYVESNGPIRCESNAWLGAGYYFWDGFYENAEWWGKVHYKGRYMVCAVESDCESDLFDLVGNIEHIKDFGFAAKWVRERLHKDKIHVAHILEFIRNELNSFHYKAVRATGVNSKSYANLDEQIVRYPKGYSYLELFPPIQICVYDKSFLSTRYRIIFPPQYREDYTI